jgi:hypothetical protein
VLIVILAVLLGGGGLNEWAYPAWSAIRRRQPTLLAAHDAAGRPDLVFALLGDFRALAADFAWLRAHYAWERRDWVATNTLLHLACRLDPRPLYFWLNGARIMAYDFAAWRATMGGNGPGSRPLDDLRREQARAALLFLARAEQFHPTSPGLWVERAGIELHGSGDPAAAAMSYRRAAELPGGPAFAARLHARLLSRLGRPAEALAWLEQVQRGLPPGEEADLMRAWIRDLESGLSLEKAIQPPVDR